MRTFWKAYEIVYISSLNITARFINKSIKQSSRFCPRKTESTYFWNLTWKSHNFKTTGPNDPNFELQLVHKIYNNFDLDKSSRKSRHQQVKVRLLPCYP